jgi:hypothetical protein
MLTPVSKHNIRKSNKTNQNKHYPSKIYNNNNNNLIVIDNNSNDGIIDHNVINY